MTAAAAANADPLSGVSAPISTSDCLAKAKSCGYSPPQYRTAYNLDPLYRVGITGKGRTIVIVDSYGSRSTTPTAVR